MNDHCPTCGRANINWLDRPNPETVKLQQRPDGEDRAIAFKQWHRTLSHNLYCQDLDLVEFRMNQRGELVPVAVFELTRFDGAPNLPASYLNNIVVRFSQRDVQGRFIKEVARRLGCRPYIVVFDQPLTEFYVYDLIGNEWSAKVGLKAIARWIEELEEEP